ncbi:MAG TPA: hypothetical protein PK335_15010 [Draconibacterium sp.]|nr:hypothetical protein [Draconibacterium sp.]
MKGLIILLFGFVVGTIVFPKLNTVDDPGRQSFVSFMSSQSGQLSMGDCELSFEDETENHEFLVSDSYIRFFRFGEGAELCNYLSFCSVNEQISPHQYTNLPPPILDVVLYS